MDLLEELEQRLQWGGIAEPQQAERIETAILEHRRVRLELLPADRRGGDGEPLRVWPLQLVHADGCWFLACEEDALGLPGTPVRPGLLVTLRFSCNGEAFAAIREAPPPLSPDQIRLSLPLPGDGWRTQPTSPWLLEPNEASRSHPYPVELDLPGWIVARGIGLRRWLRGFGSSKGSRWRCWPPWGRPHACSDPLGIPALA